MKKSIYTILIIFVILFTFISCDSAWFKENKTDLEDVMKSAFGVTEEIITEASGTAKNAGQTVSKNGWTFTYDSDFDPADESAILDGSCRFTPSYKYDGKYGLGPNSEFDIEMNMETKKIKLTFIGDPLVVGSDKNIDFEIILDSSFTKEDENYNITDFSFSSFKIKGGNEKKDEINKYINWIINLLK